MDKFGLVASVVRIGDKMNRIESLVQKKAMVQDESIRDTLLDMANYAIMTMYGDRLTETFREVIVTNGGIRLGNEALIFKDKLLCKNWIFIDDSYYLGRTRAGISVALKKIRPDASIFETYVIYDGSMGRADKVKSMYRYSK